MVGLTVNEQGWENLHGLDHANDTTGALAGLPLASHEVPHLFDPDHQKYVIYEYDRKKWDSNPPNLGVGESFWIGKTTPGDWIQNPAIK
jgi:hypothetical protein